MEDEKKNKNSHAWELFGSMEIYNDLAAGYELDGRGNRK